MSISLEGDTVLINDARVLIADIQAANGIIHVIDSVLLPPQELGSIVDIAVADGRFPGTCGGLGGFRVSRGP